jgi:hypothetical protein
MALSQDGPCKRPRPHDCSEHQGSHHVPAHELAERQICLDAGTGNASPEPAKLAGSRVLLSEHARKKGDHGERGRPHVLLGPKRDSFELAFMKEAVTDALLHALKGGREGESLVSGIWTIQLH